MAKVTKTAVRNELRAKYFEKIQNFLKESEDVLQVATNKFAFPTIDSQGDDQWVMVTVSVPLGAERGAEPCRRGGNLPAPSGVRTQIDCLEIYCSGSRDGGGGAESAADYREECPHDGNAVCGEQVR